MLCRLRLASASFGRRSFATNNRTFVQVYTEAPTSSNTLIQPVEGASKSNVRVYYPKPEIPEEPKKIRTGWGGSKFLIFIGMNVIPLAAFLYAIKSASDHIESDKSLVLPQTSSEILEFATRAVRTANIVNCTYIFEGKVKNTPISPHSPESRVFNIPEGQFVPGIKNSGLTDIFAGQKSDFSLPFNFVHFGVDSNSSILKAMDSTRDLTLTYTSHEEGLMVEMEGVAVKVQNPELKRHYWKSRWGKYIEEEKTYELIKLIPIEVRVQHLEKTRLPQDWNGVRIVRVAPTPDRLEWDVPSNIKA